MEPPVGLASLCWSLPLCYMVLSIDGLGLASYVLFPSVMVLSIDGASSRPRLSMLVSSPLLYGTVY